MKDKTIVIIRISIFVLFVISLFLFLTPEGVNFVHKHTNIICNLQYNENIQTYNFEMNSTEIINFINECKLRGIGVPK